MLARQPLLPDALVPHRRVLTLPQLEPTTDTSKARTPGLPGTSPERIHAEVLEEVEVADPIISAS